MTVRALWLAVLIVVPCCSGSRAPPSRAASVFAAAAAGIAPGMTFCNPLDLDYRFAADTSARRDIADPIVVLLADEYYLFASNSGGYWHSRDLRDWAFVSPRGLPIHDGVKAVFVHDGHLYYSPASATGLYTTDDPKGGAWHPVMERAPASPIDGGSSLAVARGAFAVKRGGFMSSAGTSSAFVDRRGNRWRIMTLAFDTNAASERRLGIFPAARDSTGAERIDGYLGDYPQLLPGAVADPLDHNATGWMLLSKGKSASASSTLDGHPAALAFDEDGRSWWSAGTGGVGEWLAIDLGAIARVTAMQVDFAEQNAHADGRNEDDYQQYLIESSLDGARWTRRVDESGSTRSAPHRYIQLDSARNARYLRITNIHAAAGGTFAIRELRIFGRGPVALPTEPQRLSVRRSADGRSAQVTWEASARATGYVVRFGGSPDALRGSRESDAATAATIDGLEPGVRYWFTVDAIGEGGVRRGRIMKEG